MDFHLNLNAARVARLEALPPVCVDPRMTVRDVLRHPMKAHAVQVARRIARTSSGRGRGRKPLSHQRFPHQPAQCDIVLI